MLKQAVIIASIFEFVGVLVAVPKCQRLCARASWTWTTSVARRIYCCSACSEVVSAAWLRGDQMGAVREHHALDPIPHRRLAACGVRVDEPARVLRLLRARHGALRRLGLRGRGQRRARVRVCGIARSSASTSARSRCAATACSARQPRCGPTTGPRRRCRSTSRPTGRSRAPRGSCW